MLTVYHILYVDGWIDGALDCGWRRLTLVSCVGVSPAEHKSCALQYMMEHQRAALGEELRHLRVCGPGIRSPRTANDLVQYIPRWHHSD
jgi:hypothetical protein